jgi:hypothetical protein|tara:strand:+ start:705 stop:1037 length:333 start_codon:yes stop_codon:yes gene_type:complete
MRYWILAGGYSEDLERPYAHPYRTKREAQKMNRGFLDDGGWIFKCELEYRDLWDLFAFTAEQADEGNTLDHPEFCQYSSKQDAVKAKNAKDIFGEPYSHYHPEYDRKGYL